MHVLVPGISSIWCFISSTVLALSMMPLHSGASGLPASSATVVKVSQDQLLPPLSGLMNGAALEFLNHQAYGGLSSQLVFGESFEEAPFDALVQASRHAPWVGCAPSGAAPLPAPSPPGPAPPGPPRPVCSVNSLTNETARLNGYCQTHKTVYVGGHCLYKCPSSGEFKMVSCEAAEQWSSTIAKLCGTSNLADPIDKWTLAATAAVLATAAGNDYSHSARSGNISSMWRGFARGGATAQFSLTRSNVQHGKQAQRLTHRGGGNGGSVGVSNHGLNCHWGYFIQAGKTYDGYFYARVVASSGQDALPTAAAVITVAFVETDPNNHSITKEYLGLPATIQLRQPTKRDAGEENWNRYNFTLHTNTSTVCTGLQPTPSATSGAGGHRLTEVGCSGALELALHTPGVTIDLDMVFVEDRADLLLKPLSDGESRPLPTKRALATALMKSGIEVMRMGGSMANAAGYRWKDFIGPYDKRQPYAGDWYRDPGCTITGSNCPIQSRGWGMWELIDMVNVFGVTPIITVNNAENPADMADFVEFAHGDAHSTVWGRKRASFGHPEPYNVTWVEIGNEQGLNTALAAQFTTIASAMDNRARQLRLPFNFSFVFGPRPDLSPQGRWSGNWSDPGLADVADAMSAFGERAFWDIHVESKAPEMLPDASGVAELQHFLAARGSAVRAVVLEENGCGYSQHCALNHAVLANMYRSRGGFVRANSITNALQAFNEVEQYSQGMLSFLPNGSFAQPTFLVNAMFAKHCAGVAELNVSVVGGSTPAGKLLLDAGVGVVRRPLVGTDDDPAGSAAPVASTASAAREVYVVRLVHFGVTSINVTIAILQNGANSTTFGAAPA